MSVRALLRAVAQVLFLAVWTSSWVCVAALVALLTWNRAAPLVMARRIWARPLLWITGVRYRVHPLPTFDLGTPHIFVMNHQSMLDIPCAFAFIPVNLRFVAKEVLKWVPFLGWYMSLTGMIFINRSKGMKAARSLTKAAARIRAGSNILVFPEGTRSKDGSILPFKRGPFVLALQAGVPIVPVAIDGSGDVMPAGQFYVAPGEVRVKMGQPIATAGRSRKESDQLMNEVRSALIQLHASLAGSRRLSGVTSSGDSPS